MKEYINHWGLGEDDLHICLNFVVVFFHTHKKKGAKQKTPLSLLQGKIATRNIQKNSKKSRCPSTEDQSLPRLFVLFLSCFTLLSFQIQIQKKRNVPISENRNGVGWMDGWPIYLSIRNLASALFLLCCDFDFGRGVVVYFYFTFLFCYYK